MAVQALGNPLGNPLAKPRNHSASARLEPVVVDFASASGMSGIYDIPSSYSYFRVSVVGAGGGAVLNLSSGGAGGGFARSGIIPIAGRSIKVTYSCPGTTNSPSVGGTASASFLDVSLVATGGASGPVSAGATTGVGVGSGGQVNSSGGIGGSRTPGGGGGGGAGGPLGNGAAGSTGSTSGYSSAGGIGGGGVGASSGGGGGGSKVVLWGGDGAINSGLNGGNGGAWGGGGGGGAASSTTPSTGGYGGMRIELW